MSKRKQKLLRLTSCEILKIFQNLEPNVAHGHKMNSIGMLLFVDLLFANHLNLFFSLALKMEHFLHTEKKHMLFDGIRKMIGNCLNTVSHNFFTTLFLTG